MHIMEKKCIINHCSRVLVPLINSVKVRYHKRRNGIYWLNPSGAKCADWKRTKSTKCKQRSAVCDVTDEKTSIHRVFWMLLKCKGGCHSHRLSRFDGRCQVWSESLFVWVQCRCRYRASLCFQSSLRKL
jgi:hypothetical protein